ncbi:hypothetical protein JTB14_011010 [Gonioctena quinquepunctata]|nr:hypothetical protein JTB14_011010 [Gonioctena quinquepunctata]
MLPISKKNLRKQKQLAIKKNLEAHKKLSAKDMDSVKVNLGDDIGETTHKSAVTTRPSDRSDNKQPIEIRKTIFHPGEVSSAILQAKSHTVMKNIQDLEPSSQNKNNDADNGWSVQRKKRRKLLVGGNSQYSELQTIPQLVELHVTRLHPHTKPEDLKNILDKNIPDTICESHTSKHPEIYTSMKVTLRRENLKKAWNRQIWPNGAVVSFFRNKRIPAKEQDPQSLIIPQIESRTSQII